MGGLVNVERDGPCVWVFLNRPEKRNAIDAALQREVVDRLEEVEKDSEARVVMLSGRGPAFCSGHDVNEWVGLDEDLPLLPRGPNPMTAVIRRMPQIVISVVNGPAVGEGNDLALICDMVVAADTATFSDLHLIRGMVPSGGSWLLTRGLGPKLALEAFTTGRSFSAREMLDARMINSVVPAARLREEAQRLADAVLDCPRLALVFTKRAISKGMEERLMDTLEFVQYARSASTRHADVAAGATAFLNG